MSLISDELTNKFGFIWTFVIAFLRCILDPYFSAPLFIMITSKKFSFCDQPSFAIVHCIALFFLFNMFRKLWHWCSVLNLAWLSSTYFLFFSEAKFAVRASCNALSSKYCRRAFEITTVNVNSIGPEFSKICMRLSKIK